MERNGGSRSRTSGRRSGRWALAMASALALACAEARAEQGFECRLESAVGIAEADAAAASMLICEELRRQSGAAGAFEVALASLGRLVIVKASRTDRAESVTIQMDSIEEAPVAAARLAQALLGHQPFERTQRIDNLLETETRQPPSKRGSVRFTVGVQGVGSFGNGSASGVGFGLTYLTPGFAVPAEFRAVGGDSNYPDADLDLWGISVGGRRYLSKRDVSAFGGAGLGVLKLCVNEGTGFYGERSASRSTSRPASRHCGSTGPGSCFASASTCPRVRWRARCTTGIPPRPARSRATSHP